MDQEVRFCKTADGVSIAYSVIGSGPPLIFSTGWVSHLELSWHDEIFRPGFLHFAEHFTYIRYDKRGVGLSAREVSDLSLDARLLDLDAIVADLKLDRFFMHAASEGGPLCIKYAALHPEKVIRLALGGTFARGSGLTRSREAGDALVNLVKAEWGLGSETMSNLFTPGASEAERAIGARRQRRSATAEVAAKLMAADLVTDVTEYLPSVRVPTLVIHSRADHVVRAELGREIAAGIPAARFLSLESNLHMLDVDQSVARPVREQIIRFFEEEPGFERPELAPVPSRPADSTNAVASGLSGTVTILFTDIVDSTSLTERLGDSAFRAQSRDLDARLRTLVREYGGTPVEGKLLGDGVMATFASASRAIEAALACNQAASQTELRLHVGLHAGDVISEGDNVYGGAVNLAARVCAISAAGEVLVSETVRALARTSASVRFEDRGVHELKGIEEAQRLFAVIPG